MNARPFRLHGANPEKLYAALGVPMPEDKEIIDFSTNASVLPWPEGLALDLPRLASRYPDDECLAIRRLVAEREGLSVNNVLFTNGSNEAMYLLASLFTGGRAGILQPAYPEYARALGAWGVEVVNVEGLEQIRGLDVLFLSNPCNPTGAYIPHGELLPLVMGSPACLFVIDEAYVDFLLDDSDGEGGWGRPWPSNLIILRSLTKFYHLSGLRVGYVVGPEGWLARLKARQPTWSVNAVAQALTLAFLQDEGFARRSRAFYRAETPRLMRAIEAAGYRVRPSRVHFFLIDVSPMCAVSHNVNAYDDERVLRGLLEHGLVARHTRNFIGLEGACLRVATRLPEENDRLAAALREMGPLA